MAQLIALASVSILAFVMGGYLTLCGLAVLRVALSFSLKKGEYIFPALGLFSIAAFFFWLSYTLAPFSIQVTP